MPDRRMQIADGPATGRLTSLGGFTFIELVIVMSLLLIITASVVPVFGSALGSVQVRDAQDDFVALLVHTQEMAVRDSREYRLYLDPETNAYWVAALDYVEGTEKFFVAVKARWARERVFPEFIDMGRPRIAKDRESGYLYIGCYPNGASDRIKMTLTDSRSRQRRVNIETMGAMGQIEVDET